MISSSPRHIRLSFIGILIFSLFFSGCDQHASKTDPAPTAVTGTPTQQQTEKPQAQDEARYQLFVHSEVEWNTLRQRANSEPYKSEIKNLRLSLEARIANYDWEQDTEPRPGNLMSDIRPAGDMIAALAFLYKLEEKPEDYDQLLALIDYVMNLPAWGVHKVGGPDSDLAGGHMMFGLSLAYDWCGDDLPDGLKEEIAETLLVRAGNMEAFVTARGLPGFQNNHNAVRLLGLFSVGVALRQDYPQVEPILEGALAMAEPTFEALAQSDGYIAAEGTPYWQYGLSALVPIAVIAKENLGIDWFTGNRGLEQVPLIQAYFMLPPEARTYETNSSGLRYSEQDVLNFGDGPTKSWHNYTKYMTYLARVYDSGLAQWMSDENRQDITAHNPLTRFLGLIWYDPDVKPISPYTLPTSHWFREQGIYLWHSSWTGNATVIGIKCTPPGGHYVTENFEMNPGSSHSQPDAGTFLAFGNKQWLIAPPGYTTNRQSAYANTILIGGKGQIGSGDKWLHTQVYAEEQRHPQILSVTEVDGTVRVICDLTPAYDDPNLISCTRTFYLIDAQTWLVVDQVQQKEPQKAEAIFHGSDIFQSAGTHSARMPMTNGYFQATLLPGQSTDASMVISELKVDTKHEGRISKPVLTVEANPATELRWATLFQTTESSPTSSWQITQDAASEKICLQQGEKQIELNWTHE